MANLLLLVALASPAMAVSGTDFSNNLFSDLAPLIALFGEQVSKQFLSQSLGFADAILFAMAPLGIITGVVSAIRLSGYTWLKAIVGRISETRGAAGLELTAATSADICELWDGRSAVRILGKPAILSVAFAKDDLLMKETFRPNNGMLDEEERALLDDDDPNRIYDEDCPPSESTEVVAPKGSLLSFDEARAQGWFRGDLNWVDPRPQRQAAARAARAARDNLGLQDEDSRDEDSRPPRHENPPKPPTPIPPIPPNLSLNIRRRPKRLWVKMAAAVSVIVQSMVIVLAALFTFKIVSDETQSKHFAFGLLVSGTTLMTAGVAICALRVSLSSKQEYWKPTRNLGEESKIRLVWLQKKQTVNDETYPSCALEPRQEEILLSYTEENQKNNNLDRLVLLGVTMSLVGFILQFVGLRYMFWAVSVVQLGAMVINTLLRVFIQLPLSSPSQSHRLRDKFELEWVVSEIYQNTTWHPRAATEIHPGKVSADGNANSGQMLQCRIQLASMAREIGWELEFLEEALVIKNAVDAFLNAMWQWQTDLNPSAIAIQELRWPLDFAKTTESNEKEETDLVYLTATRERHPGGWTKWSADVTQIEAFLSLWLFHIKYKSAELEKDDNSAKQDIDLDETNLDGGLEEFLWAVAPSSAITSTDFDYWIRRSNHSFIVEDGRALESIWIELNSIRGMRSPTCEIKLSETKVNKWLEPDTKRLLTMAGYSTVSRICGRYILANIIRHSLRFVQKINQPAALRPGSDDCESTSMESEFITSISDSIAETELMNQQEALALIVPALRERNLLPHPPLDFRDEVTHQTPFEYVKFHASLRLAHAYLLDQNDSAAMKLYNEIVELGENIPQILREMVVSLQQGAAFVLKARKLAETHDHPYSCKEDCALANSFTVPEQQHFLKTVCGLGLDVCTSLNEAYMMACGSQGRWVLPSRRFKNAEAWGLYYLLSLHIPLEEIEQLLHASVASNNMAFTSLFLMTISSNPSYKKSRSCIPVLLHKAVLRKNHEMLKMVLYYAHRPIAIPQDAENALELAVDLEDLEGVKIMVDWGVPIDSRTPRGCTILQHAADKNNIEAVKFLVEMGAAVDTPVAPKTRSALASAIENGYGDMITYLLKHGAEPNPPHRWYGTPLSLAKDHDYDLALQVLHEHGASFSEVTNQIGRRLPTDMNDRYKRVTVEGLGASSSSGRDNQIDEGSLLSGHYFVLPPEEPKEPEDKIELFPWSSLQLAAANGDEVQVASLLPVEDPKQPAVALNGRTALQAAAEGGHDAIVAMLLPLVDVNQARAEIAGMTALEAASASGFLEIVHRLISGGADTKTPAGAEGGTALQLACRNGHTDIVKLLISHGAPVNAAGAEIGGFTAIDAAKSGGYDDIVAILAENGTDPTTI